MECSMQKNIMAIIAQFGTQDLKILTSDI